MIRSILGRQGTTAALLRGAGAGTGPCQSITFTSVTGSPWPGALVLTGLQPGCPADFDSVFVPKT